MCLGGAPDHGVHHRGGPGAPDDQVLLPILLLPSSPSPPLLLLHSFSCESSPGPAREDRLPRSEQHQPLLQVSPSSSHLSPSPLPSPPPPCPPARSWSRSSAPSSSSGSPSSSSAAPWTSTRSRCQILQIGKVGEEEEGKEGEEEEDEEKEENDEEKEGNMMKPPRLSECLRTVPVSPAVQAAVFLCFRVILLRLGQGWYMSEKSAF